MSRLRRRTAVPAAVLLLGALAVAVGMSAGSSPTRAADLPAWTPLVAPEQWAGGGSVARPASVPAAPDAGRLRQMADYVSPDGAYVRIGAVEISAIGPVGRPQASL